MASFQDISKTRIVKRKVFTASASTPATADVMAVPAPNSFTEYQLATALIGAGETAVVVSGSIPNYVGATGTIKVTSTATGVVTSVAYTSRTSTTFTIGSTDFSTNQSAIGASVMVPDHLRLIVTGWQVNGYNSAGAAVTFTVRNDNPTTSVLFGGAMAATSGSITLNASGMTIPCQPNSNVEVAFGGAFTGQLEVTMEGYILPASTPMAIEYTLVP